MREEGAVRTTEGEGVDRVVAAAPRDLTVREAILAAAELNNGVPEQRQPAAKAATAENRGPGESRPTAEAGPAGEPGLAQERRHG